MNSFNSLKKSLGLLTAAVLTVIEMGCSDKITESENNTSENLIPENSVTEAEISETSENPYTEIIETDSLSNLPKKISYSYGSVFSDRDLNPDFDNITAEITLNGMLAECNNSGVNIDGSDVIITQEGIYRLSGTLDDGQIIVNAPDSKIQLILDNVDITCSTSAAIYGIDSKKIFISLAEGSVNNLTDGENYIYDDESSQKPDACIFSSDSLTINGSGTLNINSSLSGIHSKDDIVITGGNLNITSVGDGIKGKNYVAVSGGNINITSGEDGIKSTNKNDTSLGYVYIENGYFTINSDMDSIQAETDLTILNGTFNITSGGGSENSAKVHSNMDFGGKSDKGGFNHDDFNRKSDFENMSPPDNFNPQDVENMTPPDNFGGTPPENFNFEDMTPPEMQKNQTNTNDTTETEISTKGLKGGASVNITGGDFVINSADDTVHSNNNVVISGDNLTLTSGNKGIHADSDVCIEGGTININESYEGIEGTVIDVRNGDIKVKSSDDGFNASDGTTSQNGMGTYSESVQLNISGGSVYINAEGDGLDSNGDMTICGGSVIVDGPTNGGNGALDSNNKITVTGGMLIAAGSSQMAEYPNNSSTQYVVSSTFDSIQQAGTVVKLIDENRNEIINFTSAKTFDNIIISSPDILKDKTYTFYLNDTESESFTTNEIITTVGKQSTMGGGFGRGGRGDRGDFQPTTNENGEFEMPKKNFSDRHEINSESNFN
ncbi:MAG: carbohydrate-binding domain-containing protein [Ruminococcus sp.]|nr:carbohydrate-binding domain-containing protein [Ruminococcus sp.]